MGLIRFSAKFDGVAAIESHVERAASRAEHVLAIQVRTDTSEYVPMSGAPAGMDARTTVNGNTIIYPGPYSRFLHGGKVMVDPVTGSPFARKGVTKVLTNKPLHIKTNVHQKATSKWFEKSKRRNIQKWERVAKKAVERGL